MSLEGIEHDMDRIVLDMHAHLAPIMPDRLAGIEGVSWDADKEQLIVDGHALGLKPLFRPDALITWLDKNRIAHAFISIPPPLYRPWLEVAAARAWASYVNDGLAMIAERFPTRLRPMPYLPVEHPLLAAEIAAHWISRGVPRFGMTAGAGPKVMLSDRRYEPLWRVLDGAHAFLLLHPGNSGDPRLDPLYLHNLFGNPTETALAAAHLVLSGVPSRHPGLTICLAHGGGTAAAIAGRLARGIATESPGVDTRIEKPREAFRRLRVDCIAHDRAALALIAETHGADNILFGSDWPFPMGLPEPHAQLADVDPGLRQRICVENPKRLLTSN